jgi:hypothetical protein
MIKENLNIERTNENRYRIDTGIAKRSFHFEIRPLHGIIGQEENNHGEEQPRPR